MAKRFRSCLAPGMAEHPPFLKPIPIHIPIQWREDVEQAIRIRHPAGRRWGQSVDISWRPGGDAVKPVLVSGRKSTL